MVVMVYIYSHVQVSWVPEPWVKYGKSGGEDRDGPVRDTVPRIAKCKGQLLDAPAMIITIETEGMEVPGGRSRSGMPCELEELPVDSMEGRL